MKTIQVFDPALCCSTGVCGIDMDQALVSFSADVDCRWANLAEIIELKRQAAAAPVAAAIEAPGVRS